MMKVCQRKKNYFSRSICLLGYYQIVFYFLPDRQDDIQVINHLGAEFISNVKYIKEDRNKGQKKNEVKDEKKLGNI